MTKYKNKLKAQFMIEKFLDILFPKVCLNCGKQGESYLCSSCFFKLDLKYKILLIQNKPYNFLIYLGKYKNEVRQKLLKFKFYDEAYINEYFLEFLLKDENIKSFLKNFDLIIPVPMFKTKKLKRGYNQTELLAENLSKNLNIEYNKNILIKSKENKTQSLLELSERKQNVENVFEIKNSFEVKNKNIILIDDIFTTGSTVQVCSELLKRAGANKIAVLVIAKSH